MKITDIAIHVLKSPLTEPFAFSQGWVKQCSATLVEVMTEAGVSGKKVRLQWRGSLCFTFPEPCPANCLAR